MKRPDLFFILTGLVSLIANLLAILAYFSDTGLFAGWRPDRGLLVALTFVLLAYGLATWSALVWRWTERRARHLMPRSRHAAALLLDGLAAFPLLALWLHLLFSTALGTGVRASELWLLALAVAWMVTPYIALGMRAAGEALGPLLERGS